MNHAPSLYEHNERTAQEHDRAFLDFMLASTADVVTFLSPDGTILAWTTGAQTLFGYSHAEMVGRNVNDVFPMFAAPELIAEEKKTLARAMAGEEIAPYESTRKHRDGSTLHIMISASPIRDANNEIIAVARVVRDITQRKAHEQYKALLAEIVNSSSEAIISYTLDGTITSWNPAAERIYGFSAAEMVGTSLRARLGEFVAPERMNEELRIADLVAAGEQIAPFEAVRTRKDGSQVNVLVAISPVRGADDAIVGISRTVRDISERKASEAQRALLGSIVECSNDAIYTKTLDGTITTWNPAAEALFGYTSEEIVGGPVLMLFDPDHVAEETQILDKIRAGETIRHYETVRVHKNGSRIDVSVTVSPIRSAAGRITGVSNIVRDITERKQYEARLKTMQDDLSHVARLNELGQVSAGIAHELNQPLAALLNYSNLAKRLLTAGGPDAAGKASKAVAKASDQAVRAGEIVRRMRSFVEKRQSNRALEDVNAVVRDTVALGFMGADTANVTTRFDLARGDLRAVVDRVQIQQVLVNLLHNAVDAMADSPKREITLRTALVGGDTIEVSVADTGPGIAKEHADRLFMPFFTTKAGGMGIGLVISRSIVEAHGGKITAGPNPRGGSIFRFTLPAAPAI